MNHGSFARRFLRGFVCVHSELCNFGPPMKHRTCPAEQEDLLRPRLACIIDLRHKVVMLTAIIEWVGLLPSTTIRPATAICFNKYEHSSRTNSGRPPRLNHDRLFVDGIVFLALHKGVEMLQRNGQCLTPDSFRLSHPTVGTSARPANHDPVTKVAGQFPFQQPGQELVVLQPVVGGGAGVIGRFQQCYPAPPGLASLPYAGATRMAGPAP
ncbi:MAG: hypothetical protein ACOH2H_17005 [Cypionkella sp.]